MKESGNSLDQIVAVEEIAKSYATKHVILATSTKKTLWVSECLDFYDSSDLKEVVKRAATLP